MRNFNPAELKAYLDSAEPRPLLLDVRETWEYERCHLPNSELVPIRQIPAAIPQLDPKRETVVICHHGIRSRQVAMFLDQNGFSNVINLHGGLAAWARDVDPDMPTY